MGNILDYNQKRIAQVTEAKLGEINDDALMLISQNNLTRSLLLSTLRNFFASDNINDSDKFYDIETIEGKITTINGNVENINETISQLSADFIKLRGDMTTLQGKVLTKLEEYDGKFTSMQSGLDGKIVEINQSISDLEATVLGWIETAKSELDDKLNEIKGELNNELDKMNAGINYIYGYGPIVPTLLPEGKFFLQTFNPNYKWKAENTAQKYATYTDKYGNDIISEVQVLLTLKQVGEKVARIGMAFSGVNLSKSPNIKVRFIDDYTFNSAGLTIYDSNLSSWSGNLSNYLELGVFMIPTTSTEILIEIEDGIIVDKDGKTAPLTVSFNNIDDSIWLSFTGVLVIPYTDNGDYMYYMENGERIFLTETGSSEENPKGAGTN